MNFLPRLLVSGALLGCGPTVEDVCERLSKTCSDVSPIDCVDDGKALEALASERHCATFGDYLRCVDENLCAADEPCADLRAELSSCVGGFP